MTREGGQERKPRRIGTWRLLEIVQATMPMRGGLIGGGMILPEYGPADGPMASVEPDEELPGSNISEHERRAAVERERARRSFSMRRDERQELN